VRTDSPKRAKEHIFVHVGGKACKCLSFGG